MMTPHSSHHILRYQVNHPAMATKLTEMNAVLDGLVKALPDDTMLLVMGDHGSTLDGDHGTSDIINDSSTSFWLLERGSVNYFHDLKSILTTITNYSNYSNTTSSDVDLVMCT